MNSGNQTKCHTKYKLFSGIKDTAATVMNSISKLTSLTCSVFITSSAMLIELIPIPKILVHWVIITITITIYHANTFCYFPFHLGTTYMFSLALVVAFKTNTPCLGNSSFVEYDFCWTGNIDFILFRQISLMFHHIHKTCCSLTVYVHC